MDGPIGYHYKVTQDGEIVVDEDGDFGFEDAHTFGSGVAVLLSLALRMTLVEPSHGI